VTLAFAIRLAEASDLEALTEMVAADPHGTWTRASLEHELTLAWSHMVVAVDSQGVVAGFMVYWHTAGEVELLNIATSPTFMRQGVARTLMAHLLEAATRLGAPRVMLEVRAGNLPARSLYDSLGFVVVGTRKGYYAGEDALLMDRAAPAAGGTPSESGR